MSDGIVAILKLRALAAHLVATEYSDAAWFAAGLAEYQAGVRFGSSLDHALGLKPGAGGTGWWEREALSCRDQILREIAARHFADLPSRRARAARVAHELGVYRGSAWKQHKALAAPPAEIAASLRGDLFRLLKLGMPLSARTVRNALDVANETPVYLGHRATDDRNDRSIDAGNAKIETPTGSGRDSPRAVERTSKISGGGRRVARARASAP